MKLSFFYIFYDIDILYHICFKKYPEKFLVLILFLHAGSALSCGPPTLVPFGLIPNAGLSFGL